MAEKKSTELLELDIDRKWALLKQYYKTAAAFYDVRDHVVSEDEIRESVSKFKEKPRPVVRKEIVLNDWRFKLDKDGKGVRDSYFSSEYDEAGWEDVTIPHSCDYIPENPVKFGKSSDPIYDLPEGERLTVWRGDYSTWYKRRAALDAAPKDYISYINFDSVNINSSVWVNDSPVMMDHYGLYPYEIEISEEISVSRDVTVAVKVDGIATNAPVMFSNGLQTAYVNEKYPQGGKTQLMHDASYSGIAGDVVISLRNRNHIDSAFFTTEKIGAPGADILCRVCLRNATWEKFSGKVRIYVKKWLPEEGAETEIAASDVVTLPMRDNGAEIRFRLPDAALWDVDDPNLYLAHVVLEDKSGTAIDDAYESFGVRKIEMKNSHIYINGKREMLRGSHDSSHYMGESMLFFTDEMIALNILLHKKMGANCSRWPSDSRIHYKKLAEYCDQMGYMVSWCGFFEMWKVHPQAELYATRDVPAIVKSLRNSPSIIFWEMGDEPYLTTHPFNRMRWFESMIKLVKSEDTSRPIVPAGDWSSDLYRRVHVYAQNGFTLDEARARAVEELPVYGDDLVVWDIHFVPATGLHPSTNRRMVERTRDAFGGKKFGVFTEWGADALPDPEKVRHIYKQFMWTATPYLPAAKENCDNGYYGRRIKWEDWRETQACQSIIMSDLVWYIRENPDAFGAFYFLCSHDWSSFYYGVIDGARNCKLGYFVMQDCYAQVYMSGLRGNTIVKSSEPVEIMASNIGGDVSGAALTVFVKNADLQVVKEKTFSINEIKGDSAVTKIAELGISDVAPGLYGIEYRLCGSDGRDIAKKLELVYVEK